MRQAFPWLLLPTFWAARNRARRRERGDAPRALLFGGIGLGRRGAIFAVFFWLTWQLLEYEELGDYLVRLGLGWLFLTFLSFVAFSAVVTSLSTFFLSEDLRLLLAGAGPARAALPLALRAHRGPVLLDGRGVPAAGAARHRARALRAAGYYLTAVADRAAVRGRPVRGRDALVTLGLVSVFPARRARDVLMLMGLLFAVALVMLLRFIRPERLLSVQSLPDLTAFFATLQSPVTPFLPSFWAGESLFAGLRGGTRPAPPRRALVDGARGHDPGARGVRPLALRRLDQGPGGPQGALHAAVAARGSCSRVLPLPTARRALLVKDLKVFLRDTSPVVAAAAAARPRARLRLQLPRARPRRASRT